MDRIELVVSREGGPRTRIEVDTLGDKRWISRAIDDVSERAPIPLEVADRLKESCKGVVVPAIPPEGPLGLGSSTTLTFSSGMNTNTFSWIMFTGQPLEPLEAIASELLELANQYIGFSYV